MNQIDPNSDFFNPNKMRPTFQGKNKLYNYFYESFVIPESGQRVFTLPDNLEQDKFGLTMIYSTISKGAPANGNIILLRTDTNNNGNSIQSVEGFQSFAVLANVITNLLETHAIFRVADLTPSRLIIKNGIVSAQGIEVFVSIDVLNTPISEGR